MIDTAALSLAHFLPHLGEVFEVLSGTHQEALTLTEAIPLPDWSGKGRQAGNFRLAFESSSQDHIMAPGIKRFRHHVIGEFDLTIAPRARMPHGTIRYSATFS